MKILPSLLYWYDNNVLVIYSVYFIFGTVQKSHLVSKSESSCTKLEYIKEMNGILALCDLLKLNQEQIRNLKRSITCSEIKVFQPTKAQVCTDSAQIVPNLQRRININTLQIILQNREKRIIA